MNYLRQIGIVSADKLKDTCINLIGCGAVGSFTALSLSKMGIGKLIIFDGDKIEDHNLPNQFFKLNQINKYKAEATKELIEEFSDTEVTAVLENFSDFLLDDPVISAVDSMNSRSLIWEKVKEYLPPLYIDSRMGAQIAEIFSIFPTGNDSELYEKYLWSEEEVPDIPCTERSIIYTANGISAFICEAVKKYINEEELTPRISIDFKTGNIVKGEL